MRLVRDDCREVVMVGIIRACAITLTAIAMLTVAAAPARAIPEKTIKSECKAANNGTYKTGVVSGARFSSCTYTDNDGNKSKDFYVNGQYYSTKP
jgi:hypothetical protein